MIFSCLFSTYFVSIHWITKWNDTKLNIRISRKLKQPKVNYILYSIIWEYRNLTKPEFCFYRTHLSVPNCSSLFSIVKYTLKTGIWEFWIPDKIAGVTTNNDPHRKSDPRSFFYVEKWPGVHFLRPKWSFFVCRKRVVTPKPGGEKWPL